MGCFDESNSQYIHSLPRLLFRMRPPRHFSFPLLLLLLAVTSALSTPSFPTLKIQFPSPNTVLPVTGDVPPDIRHPPPLPQRVFSLTTTAANFFADVAVHPPATDQQSQPDVTRKEVKSSPTSPPPPPPTLSPGFRCDLAQRRSHRCGQSIPASNC